MSNNGLARLYLIDDSNGTTTYEYSLDQSTNVSAGSSYGEDIVVNGDHIFVGHSGFDNGSNIDDGQVFYFYQSVCFSKGSLVLTKEGYICVEKLKRGDEIFVKNNNFQGYKPLNRLVYSNGIKRKYVKFNKKCIDGVFEDLIITCGHPIYYNDDYYNPEDFANGDYDVEYICIKPEGLYTLQFEEHYVINVNGLEITSLPPYTNYKNQYLRKELYFNPEDFNEDNIGKHYPPYMLHTDPINYNNL